VPISGVRIETPGLRRLGPVLVEWTRVLDRYTRLYAQAFPRKALDNPYWNGERAAVSSLAAAAWLSGGIAIEDYESAKGKGRASKYGRSDLWIMSRRVGYALEAKLRWPAVGYASRGWERLTEDIDGWMLDAIGDARRIRKPEGRRVAALFVVPGLPEEDLVAQRGREMAADLARLQRNSAWWFTLARGRVPKHDGIFYPGVALVMQLV